MNRREFLRFLGGAAASAAVAPAALAEVFKPEAGPPAGCIPPMGPPGASLEPGFVVLEPGMSIQEAIASLPAQGGTVYISNGTWIVDQDIWIPENVNLVAQGNLTISGCSINTKARSDAPIWLLMEEDDEVQIIGNIFKSEHSVEWFSVPVGDELESLKHRLFRLYLKFKKLVI